MNSTNSSFPSVPGGDSWGNQKKMQDSAPIAPFVPFGDVDFEDAEVFLNTDGSVTVTNLCDQYGTSNTVYLPVPNRATGQERSVILINGLPMNSINRLHMTLAKCAHAIGIDAQLRETLDNISEHELDILKKLAEAIHFKNESAARMIFQSFRHVANSTNNFYRLSGALKTLLIIMNTPKGSLLDSSAVQVSLTYTVNITGAVLSIYLQQRSMHLWDR